jgi:GntR family transcriptional regulator
MRRRGRRPSSRLVERAVRRATADEARRLATDEVLVLRRVREADGEPVALETAVFPAERIGTVLDGDVEQVSVFATLAAAGLVPTAGRAAIGAEQASAEDARLLGIKRGTPLLVERRLIGDQNGVPLESTESRYVASRYGLEVDFDVELPK